MSLCLVSERNSVFKDKRQKNSPFRVPFLLALALCPLQKHLLTSKDWNQSQNTETDITGWILRHQLLLKPNTMQHLQMLHISLFWFLFKRRNKRKFLLPLERECHQQQAATAQPQKPPVQFVRQEQHLVHGPEITQPWTRAVNNKG